MDVKVRCVASRGASIKVGEIGIYRDKIFHFPGYITSAYESVDDWNRKQWHG